MKHLRFKAKIQRIYSQSRSFKQLMTDDTEGALKYLQILPDLDRQYGQGFRDLCTELLLRLPKNQSLYHRIIDDLPSHFVALGNQHRNRAIVVLKFLCEQTQNAEVIKVAWQEITTLVQHYDNQALLQFLQEILLVFEVDAQKGLSLLRQEVPSVQKIWQEIAPRTWLKDIHQQLLAYAQAHCGYGLRIEPSNRLFTNGVTIFLPPYLEMPFEEGTQKYHLLTARYVGYIEFGSLDFELNQIIPNAPTPFEDELDIERLFRCFSNNLLAKELFGILEDFRVGACVQQAYPGIGGKLQHQISEQWQQVFAAGTRTEIQRAIRDFGILLNSKETFNLRSTQPHTTALWAYSKLPSLSSVQESIAFLQVLYPQFYSLMDATYVPELHSSMDVGSLTKEERQKEQRLQNLKKELEVQSATEIIHKTELMAYLETEDFLQRNPGVSGPMQEHQQIQNPTQLLHHILNPDNAYEVIEGAFRYDEWDYQLQEYRLLWSKVIEIRIPIDSRGKVFVADFHGEYHHLIQRVRKTFEALRPEQRQVIRRQSDGDDIDFDQWINYRIDRRNGRNPDDRLYQRQLRISRNIGVAFLLDMSSSTNELTEDKQRILDVEKKSLLMIAEALNSIGDQFAVYGWSGFGREQVAFYIAKELQEPWNEDIQHRIGALSWKLENRDGAAIRHCISKMRNWNVSQKLLIILSDGRPLDCSDMQYSDDYALEDTKMALFEAKQQGVSSFCITVDPAGANYLDRIYGHKGYIVLDKVQELPNRISKIYHQLLR